MKLFRTLCVVGVFVVFEAQAGLVVTALDDSGPGTLRQAIADASGGDTITFSVTGTITLFSGLTIDKDLAITGPGATNLIIDGYGTRIFNVTAGNATISGVTLEHAWDLYESTPGGGAILNAANLTVNACQFIGNESFTKGAAICNTGPSALLVINGCTFDRNIMSGGFSGFGGGAIFNDSILRITNSTFAANYSANSGGAIESSGDVVIGNSTVVGNRSDGGLGGGVNNNGGTLSLQNSILSGNSYFYGFYPQEIAGTITAGDYNLILTTNGLVIPGAHNVLGVDPILTPLRQLGGQTRTYGLGTGSPAVDAADAASSPSTDQRGVARPVGAGFDIGAYEGELPPNQPPVVLNPIQPLFVQYGDSVHFTIPADTFSDPDADQTLSYTGQDPSFALYFDSFLRTFSGTASLVGTNTVMVVATDDGAPRLSVTNFFEVVVSKRPITVRADDLRRPFGMTEQPLTVTYFGLVGPASDIDSPPVVSTMATAASPPGPYPITVSGGSDDSYEFVGWTNGTLTVEDFSSDYSVVHSFGFLNRLGSTPEGPMIEASDGKLYGMATMGVYRIGQDGSGYQMVFSFAAITNGPSRALGPLAEGPDGALYGTTYDGGEHSLGTVFKVNKDGSGYVLLHSFSGDPMDGAKPRALALGTNGMIYGLTDGYFPASSLLFEMNLDGSGYSRLHQFDSVTEGDWPGTLLWGKDGKLYGTELSFFSTAGVVFRYDPAFQNFEDIFVPPYGLGPMISEGSDGDFYGIITYGNSIFRLGRDGSGFTELYTLVPATDGSYSFDTVVEGVDHGLYGVTYFGGSEGLGTIFRLNTNGTGFSVLHTNRFNGEARFLTTRLTAGSGGAIHGVSYYDGALGIGCLFRLESNGDNFQVTWSFIPNGGDGIPANGYSLGNLNQLIQGIDGKLYGTTMFGGAGVVGTVFSMNMDGSGYLLLHEFNGTDGKTPTALIQGSDGALYGTAGSDNNSYGNVFRLNTNGSDFSILHSFAGTDGYAPLALVQTTNGTLMGAASGGGGFFSGTVFALSTNGTGFNILRNLNSSEGSFGPTGLLLGSDGGLYLSAFALCKLDPATGDLEVIHEFNGDSPVGALYEGSDGMVYGNTAFGGAFGHGRAYRMEKNGNGFEVLHEFGASAFDAVDPRSGLVEGLDGFLYAVTPGGGVYAGQYYGGGALYRMARDGSGYTVIHHFHSAPGVSPSSGLTRMSDGLLYGMTAGGGEAGSGLVFRAGISQNHAPVLSGYIPDQTNVYGASLTYTFPANTFVDSDGGQVLSYSASNLPPGVLFDGPTRTFSSTPTNAGSYTVTVTATDNGTPAFSTNTTFNFAIIRAALVVSADDKTRSYGQANPAFTGSMSGVTNGDSIGVTFDCTAGSSSPPGNYSITPIFNDPDNRLVNYAITTNTGTLTIVCDNTLTVTSTADSGPGSLRQAILDANADPCPNGLTIGFHIPGSGIQTIAPVTGLPAILRTVSIDGYTQPGSSPNTLTTADNAVLRIQLSGASLSDSAYGLRLLADNSSVRGLVVNGFSNAAGILIEDSTGSVIEGNFIGTDASGTSVVGNNDGIQSLRSTGARFGGLTPSSRNILGGNNAGLDVSFCVSNQVFGNFVGIGADGVTPLVNGWGIFVGTSFQTQIGSSAPGARNVLSGNANGCWIGAGGSNVFQGNYVGTTPAGTLRIPNIDGLVIDESSNNIVGGIFPGEGNVLSGNSDSGIYLSGNGGSNNVIIGNLLGTDATGAQALGNDYYGIIALAPNNRIGGVLPGEGNVISGNSFVGISLLDATHNTVQGNFIGTDRSGALALSNNYAGILIEGLGDHLIGGTSPGAGNVIAYSTYAGVGIRNGNPTNNAILGNSVFGIVHRGIDLGLDDLTPNDPGDADGGPNQLQNFPELAFAVLEGGQLSVRYRVDTALPNAGYPLTVEFFLADASGQGKTFLYRDTDVTPQNFVNVSFSPIAPIANGDTMVTTATDAQGNTSEFSMPTTVVVPPQLSVSRGNGSVTISWAPATAGFVLQQNSSLNPSTWINAPSGGANPVTIPTSGSELMFRLIKP